MALIIVAHPNLEKSISNKTIIHYLAENTTGVEVRNLSQLYPDFKIDVQAEQEALLRHQTIVFQYPLYWYNMPAILKQWFDVVFEYGFAYGSTGYKLKGKNFVPSFTVGGGKTGYKTLAEHHFRVPEFCKNLEQTAYYAQMEYIDPVYTYGHSLNAGYTANTVKTMATEHAKALLAVVNKLG